MLSTETAVVQKESLGRALGRLTSGVYIVTVGEAASRDGMLTTWIQQASFEPPMLSFVVKSDRPFLTRLEKNVQVAVNVLAKSNMDIFKSFAKPYNPDLDRFADLSLKEGTNPPVFADCVAGLICTVKETVLAGDHNLALCEINEGLLLNIEAEPMSHLRKNGFQY